MTRHTDTFSLRGQIRGGQQRFDPFPQLGHPGLLCHAPMAGTDISDIADPDTQHVTSDAPLTLNILCILN